MRNVHSSQDYLPLPDLVERKKALGATISLVIPACNEAPTIGNIVSTAHSSLVRETPLLDEIVVMDGGSTDQTPELAVQAGARVYRSRDVRPELRFPEGKGTSLWKSQFVTAGEILVFVDGDLNNFSPRFVYGLAGPLLVEPAISCVKAFYERPLVLGDGHFRDHGGRVTELMIRPMLSIWYPDLARLFQPIAGEYAYRRSLLRTLPFCSGYGVEIRLLIATYRACGLAGIAQVDMGVRHHRNHPVAHLGIMSQAILLEFFDILRQEDRISWKGEMHTGALARRGMDWHEAPINDTPLPPASSIAQGTLQ